MNIEGFARRFLALKGGRSQVDARFTGTEGLAVDQSAPPYLDWARAGRAFWVGNSAAITGIAPVQALVTTAAQWAIWNADPARSMAFAELGVYLTAGTPGVGGSLWVCLFSLPAQLGASTAGVAIGSKSNGGLVSKAVVKSAVTITVPAAPLWYPIASNNGPNVTAFASSTYLEHRDVRGAIVVPPGQGLGLAVVAPAGTTPLFAPFASWWEAEQDLE